MKSTEEFIQDMFTSRREAAGGKALGINPQQRLVLFFAALIGAGALLLLLPWCVPQGQPLSIVDALFTATSAVCVTGLIVRDTATSFTPFGQVIIITLVKLGGLGYMLLATAAAVILGRRLGMTERVALKQALNLETAEGLGRFIVRVILFTLGLELIGGLVMAAAYWPGHTPGRALALGFFHSVSGFNNAGFCLFSDNLMTEGNVPVATHSIMILAIVGGLGFLVINEFIDLLKGRRKKLSMHTKIVLVATASITVLGMLGLHYGAKLSWDHSFFLSSIARTAGFNIENTGQLPLGAQFFLIPLMFIGASPGGTGGGIKTTTFALVLIAIWSLLRGRNNVIVFNRQVTADTLYRAMMIMVCMVSLLVGLTLFMVAWENQHLSGVLFEMTSALGTVGLSVGNGDTLSLSALFSPLGKVVVILSMFVGRLGPLTLGLAAAYQAQHPQVQYPEGRVSVG